MTQGPKGDVFNLTLPSEIADRISAHAHAIYSTRNEIIRRFLIDNIDVIAPRDDA